MMTGIFLNHNEQKLEIKTEGNRKVSKLLTCEQAVVQIRYYKGQTLESILSLIVLEFMECSKPI